MNRIIKTAVFMLLCLSALASLAQVNPKPADAEGFMNSPAMCPKACESMTRQPANSKNAIQVKKDLCLYVCPKNFSGTCRDQCVKDCKAACPK
jgi:hypothetical protein